MSDIERLFLRGVKIVGLQHTDKINVRFVVKCLLGTNLYDIPRSCTVL